MQNLRTPFDDALQTLDCLVGQLSEHFMRLGWRGRIQLHCGLAVSSRGTVKSDSGVSFEMSFLVDLCLKS